METSAKIDKNLEKQYPEQSITESISDCVYSIEGVSRLTPSGITDNITKGVLGINSPFQGIKIQREDDELNINIHLCVYYGYNIPQLSYDIQKTIKNTLESRYDFEIKAVNISVDGIDKQV